MFDLDLYNFLCKDNSTSNFVINIEITKKKLSLSCSYTHSNSHSDNFNDEWCSEDSFMDYEAGLRHLQGQVLYRDYYLHMAFRGLLFAFFFYLLLQEALLLPSLNVIQFHGKSLITTNSLGMPLWRTVCLLYQAMDFTIIPFLFVYLRFHRYVNLQRIKIIVSAICFSLAFHSHQNVGLWGLAAFIIVSALFVAEYFFSEGIAVFFRYLHCKPFYYCRVNFSSLISITTSIIHFTYP